jgi:mannose-6-phosphate isomerase-like protein (cupin superfamily)
VTFGEAWLPAGDGHGRHNHPDSEEILYVLSGRGRQTIGDDTEPFEINPGDVVYVPKGVFHSTYGVGWEPLRLIVVHAPGGAETTARKGAGFREVPPGATQHWTRGEVS